MLSDVWETVWAGQIRSFPPPSPTPASLSIQLTSRLRCALAGTVLPFGRSGLLSPARSSQHARSVRPDDPVQLDAHLSTETVLLPSSLERG